MWKNSSCIASLPFRKCTSSTRRRSVSRKRRRKSAVVRFWIAATSSLVNCSVPMKVMRVSGLRASTTDIAYLEELIARGSYIGMDRFGVDAFLSTEDRVATVATMCERGHADRMVLSHDASCYFDALPEETLPIALPNWHYLHIHNDVIPALRARGVTDEQLTTMLVDNPRRIFSNQGGY